MLGKQWLKGVVECARLTYRNILNAAAVNHLMQVVSARQYEMSNSLSAVPATFRRQEHLKTEAANGRLN
jgi:hypothetical protein